MVVRMNTNVPILLYHSISNAASPKFRRWTLSPQRFEEHLAYLAEKGYNTITISQLAQAMMGQSAALPARPIALTFDDGFEDFETSALPLLRRYGTIATIFIVADCVGGSSRWLYREGENDRRMLRWSQIIDLVNCGIECGSHTKRHPQLDLLSTAEAWDEIYQSKNVIEQAIARPVTAFAYPFGYFSIKVRELVQKAGYIAACAVNNSLQACNGDRLALARLSVEADTEINKLHSLLTAPRVHPIADQHHIIKSSWRLVRRLSTMIFQKEPDIGRSDKRRRRYLSDT